MELVDPRGHSAAASLTDIAATWPRELRGLQIGFLSNGKPNVGGLLDRLAQHLEAQDGTITGLQLRKPGPTTPASNEDIERLATEADLIITGIGDGGTATSWGTHDARALAALGKPTVLVCTETFLPLALSLLEDCPTNVRLVKVDHPLSSLTLDQLDVLGSQAHVRVVEAIIGAGAGHTRSNSQGGPGGSGPTTDVDGPDTSQSLFAVGWTDGLAAFLPTRERVDDFLAAVPTAEPHEAVCVPPRLGIASEESLAANAVMAGMPPEVFPYLRAAIRASLRPEFNLFGIHTSTNPVTPAVIVSGPNSGRAGFNGGLGSLGPSSIANAALGRTVRLAHQNLGGVSVAAGSLPVTLGQPGQYVFCLVENRDANPWPSLGEQIAPGRLSSSDDAVALVGATGTTNMIVKSRSGLEFMQTLVGTVRSLSANDYMFGGHPLLVLCPEHAAILDRDGWSLDSIQRYVFENATIPFGDFIPMNAEMTIAPRAHEFPEFLPTTPIPIVERPSDFLVTVSGGPSMHSAYVPSFGASVPVAERVVAF